MTGTDDMARTTGDPRRTGKAQLAELPLAAQAKGDHDEFERLYAQLAGPMHHSQTG